jgi:hypothetical protein
MLTQIIADKREFIKISQAVGMGFLVMVCSFLLRSPCGAPTSSRTRQID